MRPTRLLSLTLVALLVLVAGTATAQEMAQPAHVGLHAGLFDFDLVGDGFAPMIAGRASLPIASVLMIEGSVLAARPGQDIGTTTFLIPEGQVQLTLPFSNVTPFIGLGAGAAIDLRDEAEGGTQTWVTFSGSVGIKTWLRDRLGAQVEYRARGIGDTGGSSNEFSAGALLRL